MLRAGALLVALGDGNRLRVCAGASAQTLTNPDPKPAPQPSAPLRLNRKRRNAPKSCRAFGAGFVQLPGTDACVKIGGSVTTDATGTGN